MGAAAKASPSRSTTWSRASRKFKLLFPQGVLEGVSEFCSTQGASEF